MFSFSLKLARLDSVGDHDTGFPAGSRSASFQSAISPPNNRPQQPKSDFATGTMAPGGLRSWLSSPAFLSLQRPSGTAQVSGTMDPLKEGTKLCGKFETNLLKTPFSGSQLQRVEIVGSRFNFDLPTRELKPSRENRAGLEGYRCLPLPSDDLTFSIMPNRKAVVSPNSSHPFRASIAPMSFQCPSRARFSCP